MAMSPEFRLYQAAVELQYDRGIVYLDKAGSLMLKLQEQLGEPFKAGEVAGMEYGELNSLAERINVRYGRKGVNVTHSWPNPASPVRVEQLAPIAWDVVMDALNVGTCVTRCGARFWMMWAVDSLEEARDRIRKADLWMPTEAWAPLFGKQIPHGWTTVVEELHGTVRMSLDYAASTVQGAPPADLTDIPKFSIIFDLDNYKPDRVGGPPMSMGKAEVKEFVRKSWQRTKLAATTMGSLLGA